MPSGHSPRSFGRFFANLLPSIPAPHIADAEILAGWNARLDTQAIARKYFVPESVVYNRLAYLRSLEVERGH